MKTGVHIVMNEIRRLMFSYFLVSINHMNRSTYLDIDGNAGDLGTLMTSVRQLQICSLLNTLRPRQDGRRPADDIFNRISFNEKVKILIEISLRFIPGCPINTKPPLVLIMAWRRSDDRPLSKPMRRICVTRPQ